VEADDVPWRRASGPCPPCLHRSPAPLALRLGLLRRRGGFGGGGVGHARRLAQIESDIVGPEVLETAEEEGAAPP
jgi:hypothetical protein